jgi:hypothetical protein
MLVERRHGMSCCQSQQDILKRAQTGHAGRLVFVFSSAEPAERASQMEDTVQYLPIEGLFVRVLLSRDDVIGQPLPEPRGDKFWTWGMDASVPAGEFHIAITGSKGSP